MTVNSVNSVDILITAPNRKNDPTSYTWEWAKEAKKIAEKLGYKVIFIEKDDVNYENVTSAIREYKPRLYLHVGHGCPTALVGQRECIVTRKFSLDELLGMSNFLEIVQPLNYATGCKHTCKVDVMDVMDGMDGMDEMGGIPDICSPICGNGTNVGLLRNTIVVAIACYSASQLGRCAIKAGAYAYVGYKDLMLFPVDSIRSENIFKDVHMVFIKELLEGKSVGEAEIAMDSYEDSMIRLYKRTKYVSLPLLWNKKNRRILGDSNVRIV